MSKVLASDVIAMAVEGVKVPYEIRYVNGIAMIEYHTKSKYNIVYINFNEDTQLITLRRDGWLVDEVKVYKDDTVYHQYYKKVVSDYVREVI